MAAQNNIEICNQALTICDVETIASFSDLSRAAEIAAVQYDLVLASMLSKNEWSFNVSFIELNQTLETQEKWQYAYSLPSDLLQIRSVETQAGRVLAHDRWVREGSFIYSNEKRLWMRYSNLVSPVQMPAYFQEALVWNLASVFGATLAVASDRVDFFRSQAVVKLREALRTDNLQKPPKPFLPLENSTWLHARNGGWC